jgi:hypothetical protein|tara:strand:- start:648 stop:1235 length:588 start_codon:yes stop_codon:yes gene_type:complete
MSKPKKLYMKTPDARNPCGLTCESILRRLEVDAMRGKEISVARWPDYASQNTIPSEHLSTSTSETHNSVQQLREQPVFYSDDGHILMGPYCYAYTNPDDDGRVLFNGCTDLWSNEHTNSAMTMRLYSWDKLIEDYLKNDRHLSVRFKTQAHNTKDPADYTDRVWDLNNLYIAYDTTYESNADKQIELCGYEWVAA